MSWREAYRAGVVFREGLIARAELGGCYGLRICCESVGHDWARRLSLPWLYLDDGILNEMFMSKNSSYLERGLSAQSSR